MECRFWGGGAFSAYGLQTAYKRATSFEFQHWYHWCGTAQNRTRYRSFIIQFKVTGLVTGALFYTSKAALSPASRPPCYRTPRFRVSCYQTLRIASGHCQAEPTPPGNARRQAHPCEGIVTYLYARGSTGRGPKRARRGQTPLSW